TRPSAAVPARQQGRVDVTPTEHHHSAPGGRYCFRAGRTQQRPVSDVNNACLLTPWLAHLSFSRSSNTRSTPRISLNGTGCPGPSCLVAVVDRVDFLSIVVVERVKHLVRQRELLMVAGRTLEAHPA